MQGLVRNEGKRVQFNYEQGPDTVNVTLPDGEFFSGKIVYVNSQAQGSSLGFSMGGFSGTMNGAPYSADNSEVSFGMTSLQQFNGTADAVLFGTKGTTMQCKFRLSDTSWGLTSGGIGLCVTTTDKIIDVQF